MPATHTLSHPKTALLASRRLARRVAESDEERLGLGIVPHEGQDAEGGQVPA